jgi:hypothetical protein
VGAISSFEKGGGGSFTGDEFDRGSLKVQNFSNNAKVY